MATDRTIASRINFEIRYGLSMLDELAERREIWREMDDGERTSWKMDWWQFMTILSHDIDPYFRAGQMTRNQQARYRKFLRALTAALPTVKKLGLTMPAVPLDPAA